MLRRTLRRLGSTNRYTDGSGRALDGALVPKDLYTQTISNRAYPVKGEHWQPVVAGKPSPHKGSVVISGGGVVGLTVAAQFALRGWHTTVVERSPALPPRVVTTSPPSDGAATTTTEDCIEEDENGHRVHRGPLVRPHFSAVAGEQPAAAGVHAASNPRRPFCELEYALLTRRAADALEVAGLPLRTFRACGTVVSGVMDHPGAYNSWFTANLTEHHPFAVKMLSIDLFRLRQLLEAHVMRGLPNDNLQVFHEHVVEAVFPLRQQLVVRSWANSAAAAAAQAVHTEPDSGARSAAERTALTVQQARRHQRKQTSLTLSARKWEKQFAPDAVDYDLLVGADGVNSHLRELLDVEGFSADIDFGTRWYLLRTSALTHDHIHRWLYKRETNPVTTPETYHVRSSRQVPLVMAFPRVEADNLFSVMAYMPIGEQHGLADDAFLSRFMPDVVKSDPAAELVSFTARAVPAPTVYCEDLFNSVGLPSGVVIGDAAHHCHPFLMQGLAVGLEDGVNLLNQVDAYSRQFYDAVKQFSMERGINGDCLREMTDRILHYQRRKHVNPLLRFQDAYQRGMNRFYPRSWNDLYNGSVNHVYSKTIEEMLNGRGYTSYEYAEQQQSKHRRFYHIGRVYS